MKAINDKQEFKFHQMDYTTHVYISFKNSINGTYSRTITSVRSA